MKLCKSILVSSLIHAGDAGRWGKRRGQKKSCPAIESSSWWTDGHSQLDCTGVAIGSTCTVKCEPPYVSGIAGKPNDSWKLECRTPKSPAWKSPSWSKRDDHGCYFCPSQTLQKKPRGSKIISRTTNGNAVEGLEIRLRMNEGYFSSSCGRFLFAIKSPVPFPSDADFSALGADATFISADRTMVTFQPQKSVNNMQHSFWHKDKHDGTRIFISASDLSAQGGEYSIKTYVTCLDGDIDANDMSCGATPADAGRPLGKACDDVVTTTSAPTTTTTTKATTTTTKSPTTTTKKPTTTKTSTITTTTTTTTTTEPSGGGACSYGGTHSMGRDPNWWNSGSQFEYQAYVSIPITQSIMGGWYVELTLSNPVSAVQFWSGTAEKVDNAGYVWRFTGWEDESHSPPLEFTYIGMTNVPGGNTAQTTFSGFENVKFCTSDGTGTDTGGGGGSGTTAATTTTKQTTRTTSEPCVGDECGFWGQDPEPMNNRCNNPQELAPMPAQQTSLSFKAGASNWEKLLHMSILFYEAQRSGPLPSDNRIPWRWHSAMNDGCDVNHDLTGGWYDAGDHVKFNFPMAYSVTTIAWGIISFESGYKQAGELENALDQIKWVTDYLIKCHTGPNELWAQTADGHGDHSFWGRPEEYPSHLRPKSYKVDAGNPGTDVAAETAAALAAASIAYRSYGATDLADEALQHAREIFNFADRNRGLYHNAVPAGDFYKSWSGYQDELVWGAAWIAKATGDAADLARAEQFYAATDSTSYADFSWDNKRIGAQVLMYDITGKSSYRATVQSTVNAINSKTKTPGGMLYAQQWGPARHAMNAAFIAAQAADLGVGDYSFTASQANYMIGDNPQNQCFVVGWDKVPGGHTNCPRNPHHRSSSCPASGSCNGAEHAAGDNPMILYGALVGGPDSNDQYTDSRTDYIANEVATDYNAGWQGAIAALIQNS